MKEPFGPSELERYRIDLPPTNLRSHHPGDSQAAAEATFVWGTSSAGKHMHIHGIQWKDGERVVPRSSQWGSQFDTPRHYMEKGATGINTDLPSGAAVVLDIREALARHSDGMAITREVIDPALEALFKATDPQEKAAFFRRILLRSLTDAQAGSEVALQQFPHFRDQEAVAALVDGIRRETGTKPDVLFHEPASVDEANQGHLAACDPETQLGGAHGALHANDMLIGENWDLRNLGMGTTGHTMVSFNAELAASPDSALVAGAYFVPEKDREAFVARLFAKD